MSDVKRNFWITAEIDTPSGAKQILAGGPAGKGKDGGFKLTIKMLNGSGESAPALQIIGTDNVVGLHLYVQDLQNDRPMAHLMADHATRKKARRAS